MLSPQLLDNKSRPVPLLSPLKKKEGRKEERGKEKIRKKVFRPPHLLASINWISGKLIS